LKIWTNTKTLDGYLDGMEMTDNKEIAEMLLLGGKSIDLEEFPLVRGIFRAGVGDNNIPYDACAQRSVLTRLPSEKTKEYIYEETANFTCHTILQMMYRPDTTGSILGWIKKPRKFLGSRKLLIIGTGKIGQKVQLKMNNFMDVDTYDTASNPPETLEGKMRQADCVSLHIPLNLNTRCFIEAEKLSWMADNAVLVNTSRGPIVDEQALLGELTVSRLNAAFDVFWEEPYRGPLLKHYPGSFHMTPHIASTCDQFLIESAKDFKEFVKELSL